MAYGAILGQQVLSTTNNVSSNLLPMFVYAANGTYSFTPPLEGIYKVYCVSKGGNGGNGDQFSQVSSGNTMRWTAGAGGGSGAVGIFTLELSSGSSVSIDISDTEVNINNGQVICTSGSNGDNYKQSQSPGKVAQGGTGGTITASIPMIYQSNGLDGESSQPTSGSFARIVRGGQGGSLPVISLYPAIHGGKIGLLVSDLQDGGSYKSYTAYGGYAGAGGDGGMLRVYSDGDSSVPGVTNPGYGGNAVVILEYIGSLT